MHLIYGDDKIMIQYVDDDCWTSSQTRTCISTINKLSATNVTSAAINTLQWRSQNAARRGSCLFLNFLINNDFAS